MEKETFTLSDMKELREKTIQKWKEQGLLDGLANGDVKKNIAELYECRKCEYTEKEK